MNSTDARPSTASLIGLIARRELVARLHDRAFLISSGFLLLIIAASVVIPFLFADDERPTYTVAVVGDDAAALVRDAAALARPDGAVEVPDADITLRPVPDPAAAEAAVRAGTADAAVAPARDPAPSGTEPSGDEPSGNEPSTVLEVIGNEEIPDDLTQVLNAAAVQRALIGGLIDAGLDAGTAARTLAEAATSAPTPRLLDPPSADVELALGLGYLFAILFFFTTFMFGMAIAQSVVEEKQSRVVELLVAAVPVRVLLAGKVLGSTALALAQTIVFLAVGLVGASASGQADAVRLLMGSSGWFLVFFLLGFTMLACLWAAAGAVSSRQEDLQATTVPLQALLIIPLASVYVTSPGPLLTTLSYVPFTAPLVMPRRLLLGAAHWWEAALSAGILVLTSMLLIALATRLYEGSLLRTRTRTPWREAWSLADR